MLAGLLAGTAIPLSLWLPNVLARSADPRRVMFAVIACYPIGYVGLMIAPYRLAPLWAVLVGVATVTFPLILTLIGLRARTPEGTAALSAFTQSTGYLIAAAGPFTVGVLHSATRRLDRAAGAAAGPRRCRSSRSRRTSPGWRTSRTSWRAGRGPRASAEFRRPADETHAGRQSSSSQRAVCTAGRRTRPQTTRSGSSCRPVGPIWISVFISGHTPQS